MMPRADDFQIPYASGKYFPDHSRIQAKEHRNVMQILPHILHGIDEECCDLACRCGVTLKGTWHAMGNTQS